MCHKVSVQIAKTKQEEHFKIFDQKLNHLLIICNLIQVSFDSNYSISRLTFICKIFPCKLNQVSIPENIKQLGLQSMINTGRHLQPHFIAKNVPPSRCETVEKKSTKGLYIISNNSYSNPVIVKEAILLPSTSRRPLRVSIYVKVSLYF